MATVSGARQNEGMEIAFFDLDKTIVARSSPLALGRSFFREGLISRTWLVKSIYAQLMFHVMGADEDKMERMQQEAAKMTQGWDAAKVREVVAEVLEEVISPLIYAEALELIHDHKAAGRLVCIVSSSPEEVVEPLAALVGVERFIASRPRIEDGRYTGALDFYAYGPHKAAAIRTLAEELDADLDRSFAYSDSATDLPMLEAVGNPVVVNPDKELRKIAAERGWPVEEFRNPVKVRDRLPDLRMPDWHLQDRFTDLRQRVPGLSVPGRIVDLRGRLPEWTVPDRVARVRERDGLQVVGMPVENALWVTFGVMGAAAAAWWLARRTAGRSE